MSESLMKKFAIMLSATLVVSTIGISMTVETHTFASGVSTKLTEITGRIRDRQGHPVAGLKISEINWFGVELASAVTDQDGVYALRGAIPGRHYFNFRPLAENSRGETVIINVPAHSARMNLTVNRNPPALACAGQAPPVHV